MYALGLDTGSAADVVRGYETGNDFHEGSTPFICLL
jgi:hypothetical protein